MRAPSEAEACYASTKARYSEQCVARLEDSLSPTHWWRALKGPVFGCSSSIPPLQAPGKGLVSDPVCIAELLSSWFDNKQSRVSVELPSTCHHQPGFSRFAFRSGEVCRLLQDLDGSGSVDHSGIFPLLFRETASVLAPKLSRIFRILLSRGVFPRQWRRAVIKPIPKCTCIIFFGFLLPA